MIAESIVTLMLATLPLTEAGLDRAHIAAMAGCAVDRARITIGQDGERGWLVLVRCQAASASPAHCPPMGVCSGGP